MHKFIIIILWVVLLYQICPAQVLVPIKEDGKWGIYDFDQSKVVIEPKYELVGQRNAWGIKIINDGKVGMVSNAGQIISEPKFKNIDGKTSSYYQVELDDGSINILDVKTKRTILPKDEYESIEIILNDYFIVKKNENEGLINKNGKIIIPIQYKKISPNSIAERNRCEEYVNFMDINDKFGIVRLSDGKVIIPPSYFSIIPINKSHSVYKIDKDGLGLINHINNKIITDTSYLRIFPIDENYFILEGKEGKQNILNIATNTTLPINDKFGFFWKFNDDFIGIKKNNLFGIINYKGEIIIQPKFDNIQILNKEKGTFIITQNELKGIYDAANNKEILANKYRQIIVRDDGLITVERFGKWGLFNKKYEPLLEAIYSQLSVKDKAIKARKGKGVEIFWLSREQKIIEQESYKEFYTLKIGHTKSAFVDSDRTPILSNTKVITFPSSNYEWINEKDSKQFAYRKAATEEVLSDYIYLVDEEPTTHFIKTQIVGKRTNRNDLIRALSDEDYSFNPFQLFDSNKGEFVQSGELFTGFRFEDFTTLNIPKMTVILKDGSFCMMDIYGRYLKDEKGAVFKANYIEQMQNGMMRYAIGGEWTTEKDTLKNIIDHFEINGHKLFKQFNLEAHYDFKKWSKSAYLINAKWGYLDSLGNIAIPAIYDEATAFKYHKTIVKKDGKIGCINKKNEILIDFEYDNIHINNLGQIELEKDNDENISYLINKKGEEILKGEYAYTGKLSDGIRCVKKNGKYGAIDEKGNDVIPIEYDSLGNFNEGYALAKLDDDFFLINKQGKTFLKDKSFTVKGTSYDGLIRVVENKKYGFVDINGKIIIPLKFVLAFNFNQGLARVVVARKTGLIDKTGTFVMEPKEYELVFPFNDDGLAVVQNVQFGSKGIINKSGTEIVKPHYDEIEQFFNGYAIVKKDGNYGFINTLGNEVIPVTNYEVFKSNDGIMAVKEKKHGFWIFKDSLNQPLNNLKFTAPAMYQEGHSIITVVTDTLSYHKCLVNIAGDTLIFSNYEEEVYSYKEGYIGIKKRTVFRNDQVKITYHYKKLSEKKFRGNEGGYRKLMPFKDGVAVVQPTTLYCLMDVYGNEITSKKYKSIKPNKDGSYTVIPSTFYGYADANGKIILPAIFDRKSKLFNANMNIMRVEKGDQIGYFRTDGEWIWELKR